MKICVELQAPDVANQENEMPSLRINHFRRHYFLKQKICNRILGNINRKLYTNKYIFYFGAFQRYNKIKYTHTNVQSPTEKVRCSLAVIKRN